MVSFSCEVCNDTLVKKKLMSHFGRCPQAYFTCIDCNTTFEGMSFQKHTQCITEDQKYQGKLYQPKTQQQKAPPKGREASVQRVVEVPVVVAKAEKDASVTGSSRKKAKKETGMDDLTGPVEIKKAATLRTIVKELAKKHQVDKKAVLAKIKVSEEGTLIWA